MGPRREPFKHDGDDPWEEWYKFYTYHDDRKGDDRKDDDRKDFVDEQWTDQGDYWNDQWKHDDWNKRKHWKYFEATGETKTQSDIEDEAYDAALEVTKRYQAKMRYQAKKAPRVLDSWTWAASEWGSAYSASCQPPPLRPTSSAASFSRRPDRVDVKLETSDD